MDQATTSTTIECVTTAAELRTAELVAFVDEHDRTTARTLQNIHTAIMRLEQQLAVDTAKRPIPNSDYPSSSDCMPVLLHMKNRFPK